MTTEGPTIRQVNWQDLAAIIALLADDPLGQTREIVADPPDQHYVDAFKAILDDANQLLAVADQGGKIAGCMQLSFIPGLSRTGMWRAQIESVRISADSRGQGLGHLMIEWAIDQARQRGCGLVQLTTDKTRPETLRFYSSTGFVASHEGMKLSL